MRGVAIVAALLLISLSRGAAGVEVIESAQVDATPERAFALLTDFAGWEHVFSGFRVLRAERLDAHSARIRQLTRVFGRPVACTMAATLWPDAFRLDLVLDRGEPHDVDAIASYWQIAAEPGGGTNIELRVVMRSGLPIPAFLEREILARSTRQTLDDFVRALDAADRDALHADTWPARSAP